MIPYYERVVASGISGPRCAVTITAAFTVRLLAQHLTKKPGTYELILLVTLKAFVTADAVTGQRPLVAQPVRLRRASMRAS